MLTNMNDPILRSITKQKVIKAYYEDPFIVINKENLYKIRKKTALGLMDSKTLLIEFFEEVGIDYKIEMR